MSELADIASTLRGPHLPPHVYLHLPFCRAKCSYCDFCSVAVPAEDTIDAVLRGIEAQVATWGAFELPGEVETLYVGGGTPSLIGERLVQVIETIASTMPLRAAAEITVEANPDSLSASLVEALGAAGVTRISVGIQSLSAAELRLLGRVHSVDQALAACELVTDAGLDLSIDLMCGLPGQDITSWTATLEGAMRMGANHISVYPLALEPGTPLALAVENGLVTAPDPDLAADMMLSAEEYLGGQGLPRYEVSNYARPGHESRHNTAYWTGASYAGIGPAAHGMLDAVTARRVGLLGEEIVSDVARVRYANPASIEEYLANEAPQVEMLDEAQAAREDIMLGLRLTRGVDARQARAAGVERVLEQLAAQGLVEVHAHAGVQRWRTTQRGWLLGNEVFGRVWAGDQSE
jgi:oxygen-independent coproporphyrinogen-3 oxidase